MTEIAKTQAPLQTTSQTMKRDWNERAKENARWFITTVSLDQSEEDFDATGRTEVENWLLAELPLILQGKQASDLRVLEIGCGIGRMTRHLASVFGEVTAVDVSGEMIEQARQRLAGVDNARLLETSGVDFRALPDDYFDLAFTVYVFQHVPDVAVVRSNIIDAFRTVRPGGLLKFHTNGITSHDYDQVTKDTWTGVTFTETQIRELAAELNAQIVSIYGAETPYCWTTLRKRLPGVSVTTQHPRIELHGRADDPRLTRIPVAGNQSVVTLIATGLSPELNDAGNLIVRMSGMTGDEPWEVETLPRYVGAIRPHCAELLAAQLQTLSDEARQIEVPIPTGLLPGRALVSICCFDRQESAPVPVELADPEPGWVKIVTVRNGSDYGTDIYVSGEKSALVLYVYGLTADASSETVTLQFGEREIRPDFVGFVAKHGTWQVEAQLPPDLGVGPTTLRLCAGKSVSDPVALLIRECEPTA